VALGGSSPPRESHAAALQGKKVVLCVSGGIAAYKAVYLARSMAQLGADVRVVMTASARRFVGEQSFASVTGNRVVTELFSEGPDAPHLELARGADIVIVAPATANALAKMTTGAADDALSATLLSVRCPIVVAPAMHGEMWAHPATRGNVAELSRRGVTMVGPESGPLMSGDEGLGRMAEPDDVVAAAASVLQRSRDLDGIRVVVTAGGTQEPIDPVRFIGNRSSGLMGFSIAREAARRGGKVTLIAGPTTLEPPRGVEVVSVGTADEMRRAVLQIAPDADVVIKAAAVSDFKPVQSTGHKLKKAAGPPNISLEPTPDILAELGSDPTLRKPGSILVGFAAETEEDPRRLAELAREKLEAKGADLIVANEVGAGDSGFGARTNRAVIVAAEGITDVGLVTKDALAAALIDRVAELLGV
jgi:phosphopantothenoylcysteine decarboxylase / phosphopantothenate---cysteine ligase